MTSFTATIDTNATTIDEVAAELAAAIATAVDWRRPTPPENSPRHRRPGSHTPESHRQVALKPVARRKGLQRHLFTTRLVGSTQWSIILYSENSSLSPFIVRSRTLFCTRLPLYLGRTAHEDPRLPKLPVVR
jgi:hypothetical protein